MTGMVEVHWPDSPVTTMSQDDYDYFTSPEHAKWIDQHAPYRISGLVPLALAGPRHPSREGGG